MTFRCVLGSRNPRADSAVRPDVTSHPPTVRTSLRLLIAAFAALATPAFAQQSTDDWLANCRRNWGDRDREQACDVREATIPARGGRVAVSGGQNGGVAVYGWDRSEIRIVAKMQAQARSAGDAQSLLRQIEIQTAGEIHAEGPRTERNESWSVSFEVYVPRRSSLDLTTHNGGIKIADVAGDIRFDAVNGGVSLSGLAGDVRGGTQNGGLNVALDGDRWSGTGLDVRTENGGIQLGVPSRYNAMLETGTVNGGFNIDFPITVSGQVGRRITAQLGGGGAPVRVLTTNGGVSVRRN